MFRKKLWRCREWHLYDMLPFSFDILLYNADIPTFFCVQVCVLGVTVGEHIPYDPA